MSDLIDRTAALKVFGLSEKTRKYGGDHSGYDTRMLYEIQDVLESLPTVEPEIIRCNACRHWHQTTGSMKGFGLGDCDYLEKKLVTCLGYCYWAERRSDGQTC